MVDATYSIRCRVGSSVRSSRSTSSASGITATGFSVAGDQVVEGLVNIHGERVEWGKGNEVERGVVWMEEVLMEWNKAVGGGSAPISERRMGAGEEMLGMRGNE